MEAFSFSAVDRTNPAKRTALRTAITLTESLLDDMALPLAAKPTKVKQLILRLS
jgi:hypothetical protein